MDRPPSPTVTKNTLPPLHAHFQEILFYENRTKHCKPYLSALLSSECDVKTESTFGRTNKRVRALADQTLWAQDGLTITMQAQLPGKEMFYSPSAGSFIDTVNNLISALITF